MQICLRPGPVLECAGPQRRVADISYRAHEFLTAPCLLASGTRLADALGLFGTSPALIPLFQRLGLAPVLGAIGTPWVAGSPLVPVGEVVAVQLYRVWHHNSRTMTWRGMSELGMRGVSQPLATEMVMDHVTYRAGDRVHWNLRSAAIAPLLHLPLYLEPQVEVLEDDRASARWGQRLGPVICEELTLGQVFDVLLNELCDRSFAPTP